MTDAVIEYRDEDTETVFRWHGGAYIDVGTYRPQGYSAMGTPYVLDTFEALDVINVWDDEQDRSRLERMAEAGSRRPFRAILEGFEALCQDYLAEDVSEDD